VNGTSVQMPVFCAMVPASHGSPAPPTTAAAFMTPIAVGASFGGASQGTIAIVVGKIGPRKNPSSISATLASAAFGAAQASVVTTVTPARQAYIMPAVVTPKRAASGLIRNRPSVSPSQYPLTE
jgi:hypothetical protein